jgi:phosphoribosylformylglycinamidine (FGAM) synthase PurS component
MSFNINPESKITVKINNKSPILNPTTLTIKNQLREYQINSIQDLPDVDEVTVNSGSTIVFNSATNKYEVKPLDTTNLIGIIDGGEF